VCPIREGAPEIPSKMGGKTTQKGFEGDLSNFRMLVGQKQRYFCDEGHGMISAIA
jgi:hypothetical protein